MPERFLFDVFLSHSSKDQAVVRPLAERLRVTVREHLTAQAFPVLLVIRNSEGEVRWMEVRDWLKR